jgi:hypothetical protein
VLRDHGQRVVDLAAALVPGAFGAADAAEVEAHRGPAQLKQRPRDGLHHLVVHRAAEQRMRVAHHRQADGRRNRCVERALQAAGRAVEAIR